MNSLCERCVWSLPPSSWGPRQGKAAGDLVHPGGAGAAEDARPSHTVPLGVAAPRGAGARSIPAGQCSRPEVRDGWRLEQSRTWDINQCDHLSDTSNVRLVISHWAELTAGSTAGANRSGDGVQSWVSVVRGKATQRRERRNDSLLEGTNPSPSTNEMSQDTESCQLCFYWAQPRPAKSLLQPCLKQNPHMRVFLSLFPLFLLPSFLSGVWMTSFLTLVVPALRPATTMLPEVASRRESTWTTGECLCVSTAADLQSGP